MKSLEASESVCLDAGLLSGTRLDVCAVRSAPFWLSFLVVGRGFGVLMRSDPTRLVTRTKESNMCASTRVPNPSAQVTQIALALTGASRVVKLCFPHKSMYIGTRKMVNYACAERSRGKP